MIARGTPFGSRAQVRRPSSICMLSTGLGYGGADIQVANLARTLRQRGWSVYLVSLIPLRELGRSLIQEGFEVHSLEMRPGFPDPRAIIRLARLLRSWRPDILHCHMVHANLLGRITRLFARVPVVISTAHNLIEGGRLRELAYRVTDPLANLTTNVSQSAVKRYIEIKAVPSSRIRMMPNGVNTDRFRPNKDMRRKMRRELGLENAFVWLAIGRFDPVKDYSNMLRAFANIKDRTKTTLLIAGAGPLLEKTRKEAADLGLADSVRFLGTRNDIPDLLNAADAFVISSSWEGMPIVLLEAAATSLPMVATDVGGNGEIVIDGKTGLLCPPGNSLELASRMRHMMDVAPASRHNMGVAARNHVIHNHWIETVVDQWEAIYDELLNHSTAVAK